MVAGDTKDSTTGQSWLPVALDGVVAGLQNGTLKRPAPTVGRLTGGSHWLYAGRTNGLAGESGCGKSWAALQAVTTEMEDGHTAVFVDFEDDEVGVVARLLSMGVDPGVIQARFVYIHPDERFIHGKPYVDAVVEQRKPSLWVIDSTGESMALESCDPNSDDAVATRFQLS
ncbi:AAA family ATPase [Knoellia subterranea]|uniref:AAA family ATPase n=1 Tax=Knoellia subterranea TaxID=184882 RepID=UPI0014703FD5|nr:AAA family ATPase [Knoellia subterranea]